jgi:hypothetical protein
MLYDALHIAGYYRGLIYKVDAVRNYMKATRVFIEKIAPQRLKSAVAISLLVGYSLKTIDSFQLFIKKDLQLGQSYLGPDVTYTGPVK